MDALLSVSHHLQKVLDMGFEGRLVQLDFNAAFDRGNHAWLLHKLKSIGLGGNILSIWREFLS